MIMQGGLHMVSFRNVAVFIGVVGLMFGVASMVDAAHTKAHKRSSAEAGEMRGGPGKPEMILQGPVLSVSPEAGFMVIRHGVGRDAEEIPVEIDRKTTLMKGGRSASINDIRVGDRVRIRYSGQVGDVSKMVDVIGGSGGRRSTRG
jgi:hypothetical protein